MPQRSLEKNAYYLVMKKLQGSRASSLSSPSVIFCSKKNKRLSIFLQKKLNGAEEVMRLAGLAPL